jgi:chromosome segregation ATPase
MSAYQRNITDRSRVLTPLLATCPLAEARNAIERANNSFNESRQTQDDSVETQQDVRNVHEGVLETQSKVENIESAVRADTHQAKVDTHSELFQELRADLVKLRRAKEKRALLIQQLKERVRTMTLEIHDLESLRDSFKDIPPCTKT